MFNRKSSWLCVLGWMALGWSATAGASDEHVVLLEGSAPDPIIDVHFPSRVHAFVWRNWESAELERMAEVLGTTAAKVDAMGRAMGLPPHRPISERKHQRGYVAVIKRNWHLLNYDQMMQLLGWDALRLSRTLKEEDFLWFKLGNLKPKSPPLKYEKPTEAMNARCAEIRKVVESVFGNELTAPMEPRFAFVDNLSKPSPDLEPHPRAAEEPTRFLYSYFALYGDPLTDPSLDPYPEGLLQRYAAAGVNGVWMHTILRELAPSSQFPEFGHGHEERLENLRRLVERCDKYGIKIYLYMNEPRSMPDAFFEKYPDVAGHPDTIQGHTALCTSTEKVRDFMREGLAYVFREVPGLGGAFNITMVENLTNCYSRAHGKPPNCPRCSKRTPEACIAEVNRTIAEGVHAGNPDAKVLIWDWVWKDAWAEEIITSLPKDVYLMSVSEWDLPINRGGVETVAGEYSLSCVGPGPRSQRNWGYAKAQGLDTFAKVQVNCSWELSVVPYLPVMDLVAEHLDNLSDVDVDGLMLSWTLGGYPSPNLQLIKHFGRTPEPNWEQVLQTIARERFGPSWRDGREAWRAFSEAFREYPFHIVMLYFSPIQLGPANLLYIEPTNYHATMVGFAYDHMEHWRSVYPAEILSQQFEKVAGGWQVGLDHLEMAAEHPGLDEEHRANVLEDHRLAEAAYTHFLAVANQTRFIMARDRLLSGEAPKEERDQIIQRLRVVTASEIELARRLFRLTRADSRIGFEATNHYNYYPLDLVEKVVNCRYVLDEWLPEQMGK